MKEHDATEQAYKSPIEILRKTIIKETDDNIYKAVLDVGIKADKDELIKALEYDRQQFEKGYEAGYQAAKDEYFNFTPEDVAYLVRFFKDKTSASAISAEMKIAAELIKLEKLRKEKDKVFAEEEK